MVEPVRKCAGCGRKGGKPEFIRVVRLPGNNVVFDPEMKYEGRSLYFCPRKKCYETLMKKRAPEKLIKTAIPPDVRDAITSFLSRAESEL
jgi:uncharacterized protein